MSDDRGSPVLSVDGHRIGTLDERGLSSRVATERRPLSAEVYVGERHIGTATDVEVEFGLERRAPSVATGTTEPLGAWKVYAPKPLPPWTPEHRERVRRDLKAYPMVEVTFGPYPSPHGVVGTVTRVVDPQPTVLREERKARAANVRHYCRKCRGLGARRHHAMCPKRGRPA